MNFKSNQINLNHDKSTNQSQCALCGRKKFIGLGWHQADSLKFCRQCWPNIDPTIEWFEERSSLLDRCIDLELKKKPPLFTLLGKDQSHVRIRDGEWLTIQVIEHLSLPRGDISFEFAPLTPTVAGTVESSGGKYHVKMSKDLEDNFRSVSAILIHELMHIFLNLHGIYYETLEEYEEATDLACVLMGFGIPLINAKKAWTVDRTSLGGEDIGAGMTFHKIGYLSEKQIGYAFATFLVSRGMPLTTVQDKIDSQCLYIVIEGLGLEQIYRDRLSIKRKAISLINQRQMQREICSFSCPVCFLEMGIPNDTLKRVGILIINCPKCKSVIHFDGKHIIKFIESLR